jgi:hypothetical protein
MTDRRDDRPIARDPRFDAAWAAVSNEEPPPALDAAILAAARREVGARPRAADASVPEATRPERWWFPLAAAATIGAIALGMLQTVGRDDGFGDGTPTVVSDMPPAAPASRHEQPVRDSAATKVEVPATSAAMPDAPPVAGDRAAARAAGDDGAGSLRQAPPPRPEALKPAPDTARAMVGAAPGTGEPATAGVTATPDAQRSARPESPPAGVAIGAAPAPAPELAAPSAAPPLRFAPSPSPSQSPAVAARAAAASKEQASGVGTSGTLGAVPAERPRVDAAAETRLAGTPLPVPEWIALIRRLRDEGRIDDAAKELAAFRRTHVDHLQLLPPDLAQWRLDGR